MFMPSSLIISCLVQRLITGISQYQTRCIHWSSVFWTSPWCSLAVIVSQGGGSNASGLCDNVKRIGAVCAILLLFGEVPVSFHFHILFRYFHSTVLVDMLCMTLCQPMGSCGNWVISPGFSPFSGTVGLLPFWAAYFHGCVQWKWGNFMSCAYCHMLCCLIKIAEWHAL